MTIDTNHIKMISAKPDQIYFPCKMDENLPIEALKTVWERGYAIEDITSVIAYLVPHISRTRPLIGYVVEVTASDGHNITTRIHTPTAPETVAAILDSYFDMGAPGLDAEYRACYERQHAEYRNHSQGCMA